MISDFLPRLEGRSLYFKLVVLLLLIAVFLLLSMVIGIVIALPFFGLDAVMNLTNMDSLNGHRTVVLLKFFQMVNQLGVFILPALAFAYLYNRKPIKYLHLSDKIQLPHLFLSVLLIIVSLPAINRMVVWNEQMDLPDFFNGIENWMKSSEDQTQMLTDAFLNVTSVVGLFGNLIVIALLAAVGEELLFRGVILRILYTNLKNVHLAVFISAVLFSALHMQFYGFLPRMVLGMLFGYIFIWSGTLWLPIVLHFIFNGISVVAAFLYNKGMISTDVDSFGTSSNDNVVYGSFIASVLLLFIIYWRRIISIKKEEISDDISSL